MTGTEKVVLRTQVQEYLETVALGREEARHHVRVSLEQPADSIHPVVRQAVHVYGDDGVVAQQAVRLPQRGVISREREKRELFLHGVRFGKVAQAEVLFHLLDGVEVGAVADIGYHGGEVCFAGNGGETAVSGNLDVIHLTVCF